MLKDYPIMLANGRKEAFLNRKPPPQVGLSVRNAHSPQLVNVAHSRRHDTASRRGVTGAREVNPAKPHRGAQRPQSEQACVSPHGAGRENEKSDRQALAAEKANGRDVCTVGAHSGRIGRRRLGPRLKRRASVCGVHGAHENDT